MTASDTAPAEPTAVEEAPVPRESRARRRGVVVAVAAALIVFVGLLVLPGVSTIQSGYYDRYPEVRESIAQWETSTHSRMSCASCHIEPGVVGHLMYGLESIPAFYSQLFQGASESNLLGAPSSEACLRCHTLGREVSADGDVLISHRNHIELREGECSDCHLRLVHHEAELGLNRPPMTMCMERCHNASYGAPAECKACHTRKNVPADHQRDDWLVFHREESDKQECGSCHDWMPGDFCEECHKTRPRSHEGNFKTLHAPRAAVDSEGCLFCHNENNPVKCEKCH